MNEANNSPPSSSEIDKAGENMLPWQAAMSRARENVWKIEPDFLAAGFTEDNVKAVAEKAGDRAKLEFEQKQGEDPLRYVIEVMKQCAETDEEKAYVETQVKILEAERNEWKEWVKREKRFASQRGQEFKIEETLKNRSWITRPDLFFRRDSIFDSQTGYWIESGESRISFSVGWSKPGEKANLTKFHERVLHGLGVLSEGQTIDDLQNYPKVVVTGGRGPSLENASIDNSHAYVSHLPAKTANTEITAWVDGSRIDINLTAPALEKVNEFPSS